MKEPASRLITVLLSLCLGGVIGYGLAMRRLTLKEEVHYVRGETVTVAVELPAARAELLPDSLRRGLRLADMEIPPGTVFPDSADLRPTVYDWNLARHYTETLPDSQYGKWTLDATVQYNRLQDLKATVVPVRKETVRYVTPAWQPYAMMQYSSLGGVGVGGGVFYKKTGYYIMYNTDFRNRGVGAGVIVRF
ncbi:MAG: hypothetical protein LBR86_06045 [Tannerella sp.]|jgi:hypothetical protein|nr:hypothetical protein [Tannerella sp.]